MISHLQGTILHRTESHIILDVKGVGYKVTVTGETLDSLANIGNEEHIGLWTYMAVRENSHDLYGFLNLESQAFFELLITVSGIGPKTAMGILNLSSVRTLRSAVASGDATQLTKISGIGKKTAEKIVLELKSKVEGDADVQEEIQDENDTIEALKGLGYPERAVREALKKLDKGVTGTGERVKQALKLLGK